MPWACQYPRMANHDHLLRDESRILSRIRSLSRPIRCSSTARPSITLTTMCNMARGTRTTSLRRCDRENERVPEQRQDDTGQCSARISSPKSPDPTATSASCPWRGGPVGVGPVTRSSRQIHDRLSPGRDPKIVVPQRTSNCDDVGPPIVQHRLRRITLSDSSPPPLASIRRIAHRMHEPSCR